MIIRLLSPCNNWQMYLDGLSLLMNRPILDGLISAIVSTCPIKIDKHVSIEIFNIKLYVNKHSIFKHLSKTVELLTQLVEFQTWDKVKLYLISRYKSDPEYSSVFPIK